MPGRIAAGGRRRTGWILMAAGAAGVLVVAALVVVTSHGVGGQPAGSGTPNANASPQPSGVFGTPPPALELRPRLLDGSLLAQLTLPGAAAPIRIVEGLVEGADAVGHDTSTAYPGEPHAMVLQAGPLVKLPSLPSGAVVEVAATYGVFRYQVTSVGPPPSSASLDAPVLRLLVGSGTRRTELTATLIPGDPQTAAEISEEVAVSQAQEQAIATGLAGTAPDRLVAPCSGPVSQGFGPTSYSFEFPFVYKGVFYAHFHTGIDIAVPIGTEIHAAAEGVVVLATTNVSGGVPVGFGTYILIAHGGGRYTLYGHLSALGVHVGEHVRAGQVIALSGSTGNSTGPHLHFEVRDGSVPVDPLPLLS